VQQSVFAGEDKEICGQLRWENSKHQVLLEGGENSHSLATLAVVPKVDTKPAAK